ncbi:uncharacterized protein [Equus asinus]|uniref:uncharacterized protein n=1 Tax=Equus asinus TaxID=9793 RepID=UPI0038F67119
MGPEEYFIQAKKKPENCLMHKRADSSSPRHHSPLHHRRASGTWVTPLGPSGRTPSPPAAPPPTGTLPAAGPSLKQDPLLQQDPPSSTTPTQQDPLSSRNPPAAGTPPPAGPPPPAGSPPAPHFPLRSSLFFYTRTRKGAPPSAGRPSLWLRAAASPLIQHSPPGALSISPPALQVQRAEAAAHPAYLVPQASSWQLPAASPPQPGAEPLAGRGGGVLPGSRGRWGESGGGLRAFLREGLRVKPLPPFLFRAEAPARLDPLRIRGIASFYRAVKEWYWGS